MKGTWAIVAVFALAAGASAARAANPEGASKAEIDALVKDILANAESWLRDRPDDGELDKKLKSTTYTEKSIPPLKLAMATRHKDPAVDLYVDNKLLVPMLMAKPEVIRLILTSVQPLQAAAKPKSFAHFPPGKATRKAIPPQKTALPGDKLMELIVDTERSRDQKVTADLQVAKYSSQAALLTLTTGRLLLYADSPETDKRLITLLTAEEREGHATFLTLLDTLAAEAEKMDEARAKGFYQDLNRLGTNLRATSKTYTDYGKPVIRTDKDSYFETAPAEKDFCPGIKVLTTVNLFAPRAKMPAVKVPTKDEIVARGMMEQARLLLSAGKNDQAKKLLEELVKQYPNTPQGKEAATFLKRFSPPPKK